MCKQSAYMLTQQPFRYIFVKLADSISDFTLLVEFFGSKATVAFYYVRRISIPFSNIGVDYFKNLRFLSAQIKAL